MYVTTSAVPPEPLLQPDSLPYSRMLDREEGGAALSDPYQGLKGHLWEAHLHGHMIKLQVDGGPLVDLVEIPGAHEIALAFDQNMRPVVAAATQAKELYLYWYDPTVPGNVLTHLGAGRTPRLTLDDKRAGADAYSDVILGYISGRSLVYRAQRDRFTIPYTLHTGISGGAKLRKLGMTTGYRLQFEVT